MAGATTGAGRGVPKVRVLFGTERFSSQHSWSELTALMPAALQATVDVQWCPPGAFAERARNELIDVVVPLWTELDAETIDAGQFGLVQQFGAGVENAGETRPLRHSPEAPSASSASGQSGHSWRDGSTRSKFG
jgi:hypothetical protein